VTFCLEPYRDDRGKVFAKDVRYLVRRYGEKRGYDALLILKNADGRRARSSRDSPASCPRTPRTATARPIPSTTTRADAQWRSQTDEVREALRGQFRPRDAPRPTRCTGRGRWPPASTGSPSSTTTSRPSATRVRGGRVRRRSRVLVQHQPRLRHDRGPRRRARLVLFPAGLRRPRRRPPWTGRAARSGSAQRGSPRPASPPPSRPRCACRRIPRSPTPAAASSSSTSTRSTNGTKGHAFEPMKDFRPAHAGRARARLSQPRRRVVPPRHPGRAPAPVLAAGARA
jgi:hypothetical protein